MRVGVLGGTGPAGRALAVRLASVGVSVTLGSRSLERAETVVEDLTRRHGDLPLTPALNAGAAGAGIVVVATPWDGAADTVAPLADDLSGKVVVSMANALVRTANGFEPLVHARGSVAQAVQCAAPGAMVAAALHHLPAKDLAEIGMPVEADVLVCSDHPAATRATSELVASVPGLRPLDAGSLSSAGAIESMTAVLLNLNARYRSRASLRVTGVGERG